MIAIVALEEHWNCPDTCWLRLYVATGTGVVIWIDGCGTEAAGTELKLTALLKL